MAKQSQKVPGLAQLAKACPVVIILVQAEQMLCIRGDARYAYQQHVYILGSFVLVQLCLNLLEPVTVVLNAVVVLQAAMNSTAAAASSRHEPPECKWLTQCRGVKQRQD